jgi:hypothetical protein
MESGKLGGDIFGRPHMVVSWEIGVWPTKDLVLIS